MRIPLIFSNPTVSPRVVDDRLAATVDIAPTIAQLSSLQWSEAVDGIDLMGSIPEERTPVYEWLLGWHTSLGALILLLAMMRIANRLRSEVPGLPATMPAWEHSSLTQSFMGRSANMS